MRFFQRKLDFLFWEKKKPSPLLVKSNMQRAVLLSQRFNVHLTKGRFVAQYERDNPLLLPELDSVPLSVRPEPPPHYTLPLKVMPCSSLFADLFQSLHSWNTQCCPEHKCDPTLCRSAPEQLPYPSGRRIAAVDRKII